MVQSKKKGNTFEREIAKILSKNTGVEWRRVPMSGAYGTITKSDLPQFKGDVYSEDPEYQNIVVECKSYKDPVLMEDIFKKSSNLNAWLLQTIEEAGELPWILFFKTNRHMTLYLSNDTNAVSKLIPSASYIKFHSYKFGRI